MNVLILVGAIGPLLLASPAASRARLVPFALEDQEGNTVSSAQLAGKPVIVVGADRRGRRASETWSIALRGTLERQAPGFEDAVILRVADLRSVPAPFRPIARQMVRDLYGVPLLLDWTGQLADPYVFEPGVANVLVFDRTGRLIVRRSGPAPEGSAEVSAVLSPLLGPPASGGEPASRIARPSPILEPAPPSAGPSHLAQEEPSR